MITDPTTLPVWRDLAAHAADAGAVHLRRMFAEDADRAGRFTWHCGDLLADASKQRMTAQTLRLLHTLAVEAGVAGRIAALFAGDRINASEGRAALHVALRGEEGDGYRLDGQDIMPVVLAERRRLNEFCERIRSGTWHGMGGRTLTDVVNIGIGGSDLGPRMAVRALAAHLRPGLEVHFVSNIDGADLGPLLGRLDPERTLFVVASKTFTTLETLRNATSARDWLQAAALEGGHDPATVSRHFAAVTANAAAAAAFGVSRDNTLEFWDWVGGRSSLWSAVGLPLALAIDTEQFAALLAGARAMDLHFRTTPPEHNLPLNLALIDVWNANFLGAETHAVIPYSRSCDLLPAYLQQLEMESNGKSVTADGRPLPVTAAPILWGSAGTDAQHAYFQLLHQGGRLVPCDFIAFAEPDFPLAGHQERLLSCCFAQTEALMNGRDAEETRRELAASGLSAAEVQRLAPHKTFPGNQPTTTLLLPRLSPYTLGMLIALYEHKVFAAACIWGINPFDQWGVELGKQMATHLLPLLEGDADAALPSGLNPSTRQLIDYCRRSTR